MNYLKLINQFWQLRRSRRITNLQADVYYFLMQECNIRNWENPFQVPNGLICVGIGISEKSLIDARNALKQIGLIDFKGGITKKVSPTYYLLDCCNMVSNKVSIPGGNAVSNQGGNEANINNKQNKTSSSPPRAEKLFVKIENEQKELDYLKDLFCADEGLRRRWLDFGFKHEQFEAGFEHFMSLKHGLEYPDIKDFRNNFFFWIPNYVQELKKKIQNEQTPNGAGHQNGHRRAAGKAKGGSIADLQALKQSGDPEAVEPDGDLGNQDDHSGTGWQEAEVVE